MIESEEFWAEYVALQEATEANIKLWYKLKIMGVVIDGDKNVFSNNQSVVFNMSLTEST